ncbi:glycosyltransferase family 39 protein [Omnitrophica bacterium]|nr:glycosyltransferase family 39 protein [Candidatus Omnitrophota bacterium]
MTLNDCAKELAVNNTLRSSAFESADGFGEVYLWQPPLQPLLTAVIYKLFGFGIWQTRVPPVFFGSCLAGLLFIIGRKLFQNQMAGFLSALFFILNPLFLQMVRSGRMDGQFLFLSVLGIYFFFRWNDKGRHRKWLTFSGFAFGAACITHPTGIVWVLAGCILLAIDESGGRIKNMLTFTFSAALFPMMWILWALRTPELFWKQFIGHGVDRLTGGSIIERPIREIYRYVRDYRRTPLLLISYAASFVWFIRYRKISPHLFRSLFVLFMVPFLFSMFFMTKEASGYYSLLPCLILSLCTGAMFVHWFRIIPPKMKWIPAMVFTIVISNMLASGLLGRYMVLAQQWRFRDYRVVESAIDRSIPKGSLVIGPPQIWYAIVKSGSTLKLGQNPDPAVHEFAVLAVEDKPHSLPGYKKIAEFGKPLPPLFGRIQLETADYNLEIWKSDIGSTDGERMSLS